MILTFLPIKKYLESEKAKKLLLAKEDKRKKKKMR
jgi:hypothetical protein